MEPLLHTFDPNGDIILILRDLSPAFAVWKESAKSPPKKRPRSAIEEVFPELSDKSLLEGKREDHLEEGRSEHSSVEMRVCSRHLVLASSYFKKMLDGDWKEAKALQTQQTFRMEIKEPWDPDALRILMDIMHGRTRKVPKSISLEMLAKIAVLVDYYQCLEVVEVWVNMWIEPLKITAPKRYSRDTILWMCISWVFRQRVLFQAATSAALMHSRERVQTMELPIPESVIGK